MQPDHQCEFFEGHDAASAMAFLGPDLLPWSFSKESSPCFCVSSGLLGAFMASEEPPDIAGQWSGEAWGTVVLKQTSPGEYSGIYTVNAGPRPGRIQLKWSPVEQRFNGTWRRGKITSVNSP